MGTLHANTFIPKVIAEARRYEITGDESSRTAAEYFLANRYQHSFATGEIEDKEHFQPSDYIQISVRIQRERLVAHITNLNCAVIYLNGIQIIQLWITMSVPYIIRY